MHRLHINNVFVPKNYLHLSPAARVMNLTCSKLIYQSLCISIISLFPVHLQVLMSTRHVLITSYRNSYQAYTATKPVL